MPLSWLLRLRLCVYVCLWNQIQIHFCINSALALLIVAFVVPFFESRFSFFHRNKIQTRTFIKLSGAHFKLLSCIKSKSVACTMRAHFLLPLYIFLYTHCIPLYFSPLLHNSQENLMSYNWILRVLLLDPHLKSLTLLQINHKPTSILYTHTHTHTPNATNTERKW